MKSTSGVCCWPRRTHEPLLFQGRSRFSWPNAYFSRNAALPSRFVVTPTTGRVVPGAAPVGAFTVTVSANLGAMSGVTRKPTQSEMLPVTLM